MSVRCRPVRAASEIRPSVSPFRAENAAPAQSCKMLHPSLIAGKIRAQESPPQGNAVSGQRFDSKPVPIHGEQPARKFQAEPALLIGAHPAEVLNLHHTAAQIDRGLPIKAPGRLAQHPAKPAAQGEPPGFLLFHTRSLPAGQNCAPYHIYMEPEGVCMNQLFRWNQMGLFLLALAAGILPFAVPEVCAAALREGLTLCSGPLLLSLFPFLIVSTLLIQCPAADVLGLPFCPVARLIGVRAPAAGQVLLIGSLGGFAPAASAAAGAVRSGQLTAREADALLPACVCSGPSFVVLTVGQSLLGSAELGVLLFASQITANYLTAALLNRFAGARSVKPGSAAPASPAPPRLDEILADAAITYCKLCGFILFFRMLAAGAGALLPAGVGTLCSILLEVCSGCDLASRTGRWGSLLCCAALSVQGLSVLLQVRTICPAEISLRPLLAARAVHLPLSVALFWLGSTVPVQAVQTFTTLTERVVVLRRVPLDCALLAFAVCCITVEELARS